MITKLSRAIRRPTEPVTVPTCSHKGPRDEPCPDPPTHNVTWPTQALWSALYCENHVNQVRRVPGVSVTRLDGEEE